MTKRLPAILLSALIIAYIAYFGTYSVLKFRHLYSEYFDLGIMHHTVYNSYMSLKTGDWGRMLELTDPHGTPNQIKRMAIHNDPMLALLAPFYFIHQGPETILIIQTVVLALGALAVFKIAKMKLQNSASALIFAFAYLMYSPMQSANIFEFHAVTFATTGILFMFYFWMNRKYKLSLLFMILVLLTKEEVGLTLGMFGIYAMFKHESKETDLSIFSKIFPYIVTTVSWGWSLISVFVIIPFFNHGNHFASGYYSDALHNWGKYIFSWDTLQYFYYLLGPLVFLSIAAPQFLLIAAPELGINLLSSDLQLRALEYHYVSAIQPWVFIGAIFGLANITKLSPKIANIFTASIIIASLYFAYLSSPLPLTRGAKIDPLLYDRSGEYQIAKSWANKLSGDSIKVSTTDQIAPLFTSRRYFYIFSDNYRLADYAILSRGNLEFTYRKDEELPAYQSLKKDNHFKKIFDQEGYEVYKNILSSK